MAHVCVSSPLPPPPHLPTHTHTYIHTHTYTRARMHVDLIETNCKCLASSVKHWSSAMFISIDDDDGGSTA